MMSSKVMITYKRKRVTSHAQTADDAALDSSPAVSSSRNVAASTFPPKHEICAENEINEDNFQASMKRQGVCQSVPQNNEEELAEQRTGKPERGQKEPQLCGSFQLKEQPEICCAPVLLAVDAETHSNKLECTMMNNPSSVSSSVCDPVHISGMTSQTEGSSICALAEISSHQGSKNTVQPTQCKNRFSPLLTFRRRVKNKTNLGEPTEENCMPDNNKQCSTLTCNPPSLSLNATPLPKHARQKSLDNENKVATVGITKDAEHSAEKKCSHVIKSPDQHIVPSQTAEVVNSNVNLEYDGTPLSKFTGVQDARVVHLSKTLPGTFEVQKVNVKGEEHVNGQTSFLQSPRQEINANQSNTANKSVAEDLLESQGSTKNVPIVVLDDDGDARAKELENPDVLGQEIQNKNKSTSSLGRTDLNSTDLQQEGLLHLDDSSVQRQPDQDLFRKQKSQPIERMFFTKDKDTLHGKQYEGSSTMHTLCSNFFDLTPPWNTGSFKGARSLPSEPKFKIMDKGPEFNLDLSLDSLQDSSVSGRRSNKLILGGSSSGSHKVTEKLGTYSYKRHSAPWTEEELDFLWIGVRRYGINNWEAMLRDTRLRFSNSRMPEDLAKQWDKEQKKLWGVDLFQSIRASALGPAPPPHIAEDYLGSTSFSGCLKSPFLAAQTDLSLGDVYIRNTRASERGQNHFAGLGMLNLHGIDGGPRNMSLRGFPDASSSYGRSGGRRKRASKLHKSYYDSKLKSPWLQEQSERMPQLLPMNQQPINSLPQWLTKDVETGTSRLVPEMWPSIAQPGHSAEPPRDILRTASLFSDDVKPHAHPGASLKRAMRRNADWRSFSKRLFQAGDGLDLNQGAAAGGAAASDTGASSEETVSDS